MDFISMDELIENNIIEKSTFWSWPQTFADDCITDTCAAINDDYELAQTISKDTDMISILLKWMLVNIRKPHHIPNK